MRPVAVLAGLALAATGPVTAGTTPLARLDLSPDTTVTLAVVVPDESVVEVDLAGGQTLASLPGIPTEADIVAIARLASGEILLALDTTASLPGVAATPQDVLRYDGITYSLELDGSTLGIPNGVRIDAVAVDPGGLLLSFDVSENFGGLLADDEDLLTWDGANFGLAFDGSAAGIDPALDLDAAHRLANGHLLLSFDGSGSIGGVAFDDEDVVEHDPGLASWDLAYDASAADGDWPAADLDALSAVEPAEVPIFADGFESGNTSAWSASTGP